MRLYRTRHQTIEAYPVTATDESMKELMALGGWQAAGWLVGFHVGPNITYARPGQVVVRRNGGIGVMDKNEFEALYEPVVQV